MGDRAIAALRLYENYERMTADRGGNNGPRGKVYQAFLDAKAEALAHDAPASFQARVQPWMMACFGPEISADRSERNHRFLEEALELVQSTGCTASEAHQLVDYVYGRPVGDTNQEIGGVMVTLAALCLALNADMHAAGEAELARVWTKVEAIRAKQAAKPKHSPLPQDASPTPKLPAHVEIEIGVALAFVRDGGLRSAASVLRNLARWLERGAAARELAVGIQFSEVTPFLEAYPTPWRVADREVVDRDGCNVQDFDDDPDTVDFWRCVVDAVNAWAADPINLQGSGPAPIEPREG